MFLHLIVDLRGVKICIRRKPIKLRRADKKHSFDIDLTLRRYYNKIKGFFPVAWFFDVIPTSAEESPKYKNNGCFIGGSFD